jgi:hypothetical protein
MIRQLRTRLDRWHKGAFALCCTFVIAQTIGLAHTSDLSKHVDRTACQICLAIGHAAGPPPTAKAPAAPIAFEVIAKVAQAAAAIVQPTFSPHAARAPPTSL